MREGSMDKVLERKVRQAKTAVAAAKQVVNKRTKEVCSETTGSGFWMLKWRFIRPGVRCRLRRMRLRGRKGSEFTQGHRAW